MSLSNLQPFPIGLVTGRDELQAAGSKGSDNRNLYVYGDHLGSAVLALDANQKEAMRLGYSPFGQVYRKQNDTKFWKLNSGVNANNQLNQLMPYQYTGRYTEGATGYTNLDARWYNPYTQRFNQPDYWSFNNTGLPKAVQHELLRFTGLNTSQLLRDPAQQMRYGYVSNNPLLKFDIFGLAELYDGKISVEIDGEFGGKVETTINSMLDTPEYRDLVDQIYEERGQITVKEINSNTGGEYDENTNTVSLSQTNNNTYKYTTAITDEELDYLDSIDDGDQWAKEQIRIEESHNHQSGFSLEREIFHETYHGTQDDRGDYSFNPGPYENPAIAATNSYMSDYYDEPFREGSHSDVIDTGKNQRFYHECP